MKSKILILAAILLTTILVLFVFNNNSKKINKPTEELIAPVTKEFGNIKYDDLKTIDFKPTNFTNSFKLSDNSPSTLPIYQFTKTKVEPGVAENIISKNNLKKTQTLNTKETGQIILSNNGPKNLVIYSDAGYFIYTDESEAIGVKTLKFTTQDNIDTYKKIAEDFLKTQFDQDLSAYRYNYFAYIDYPKPHLDVVNIKEEAGAVEFIYQQVLDNIPVVSDYKLYPNNQISIYVSKSKKVIRIDSKLPSAVKKLDKNLALITQADLDSAIKDKQPDLISADIIFNPGDIINSADITAGNIIYLERDDILVPTYKLYGDLKTDKGDTAKGSFYINAVKN